MSSRVAGGLLCALLVMAGAGGATADVASLEATARAHQAALTELLRLQEGALARAERELTRSRDLAARELIARRDVDTAEAAVREARAAVDRTREEIERAGMLAAEVRAAEALARQPAPSPGDERVTPEHVASIGRQPWSLARIPVIEAFFDGRFGRPLPVSARGQTALHDRFGFDHRQAIDVAVHPDSLEGKALIDYLRAEGLPFIAFRGAKPRVSTGAHVHIGEPSPRIGSAPERGWRSRR
jgi:hypothetical protein